jgi:hypothetical protein
LTEFSGKTTLTVSAYADIDTKFTESLVMFPEFKYKQVMVVNFDFQQDKVSLAYYSAYSFLNAFLDACDPVSKPTFVLNHKPNLIEYFHGRFKKIVVKGNTEQLEDLKATLSNSQPFIEVKNDEHHSITFHPATDDFFNEHTSHFKLL